MITVDKIMSNNPCVDYTEDMIKELIGDGKTPLEILDLDIPAKDRIWVLTREGVLPDDLLRLMARRFALSVIHLWDAPGIVVQYLETGDESLRSAAMAAASASLAAARDAVRAAEWASMASSRAAAAAAADAAVYAALWNTARADARDAASASLDAADDVRDELMEIIRDILNGASNENKRD